LKPTSRSAVEKGTSSHKKLAVNEVVQVQESDMDDTQKYEERHESMPGSFEQKREYNGNCQAKGKS
jgi:hypothetical protein